MPCSLVWVQFSSWTSNVALKWEKHEAIILWTSLEWYSQWEESIINKIQKYVYVLREKDLKVNVSKNGKLRNTRQFLEKRFCLEIAWRCSGLNWMQHKKFCNSFRSPLMETLDKSVETLGLESLVFQLHSF